ncbi:hypothetical protein WJX79_002525 [Trebouxia sp. C0005]
MSRSLSGPAKAADTSDADSDEEHWKSLSAKAAKPKLQLQTVKAVKAIQAETSEDFSSADEWQTAKAGLRRASVEQATSSLAAAARAPSRRSTAERQPASSNATATPSALPTRPPGAPINRLQPQARPVSTSAPDQASNLARRSRLNQSTLQQLQTSLVQTLTSTVDSAMAQMRADMQQLDGKWSQWWRQSSDMCDSLQHQMSLLCSQQEVTAQRMQQLESQVAEHKQPQQAVPLGMGGEGSDLGREDPRVSSVLERLSQLEGRVGTQLDQLLQLQQQQTGGYVQDRWHDANALHEQRHDSPQRVGHGRALDDFDVRHRHAACSEDHAIGAAASKRSKSGSPAKRSRGARGGDEHADWLVTLGEQLGGLQAQMQTTASTSSLQAVQHETAELRSALDARSAEASLYRKQYEGLCRKLDSLDEQQRQASAAARAKVQDCWWSPACRPGSKQIVSTPHHARPSPTWAIPTMHSLSTVQIFELALPSTASWRP